MVKKNIALISPSENAYSETFIQQHRNNLEGNIIFYFNGSLPKENNIEGKLVSRIMSLFYKVLRKIKITKFNANELALVKSFKKQKIQVVVAEYGTTGVAVLNVCKYLKLPLIPIFHGYDASIKEVLANYKTRYQKLFEYSSNIIAVSHRIAETLIGLGCDQQKIIVTPCAPDNQFFKIEPNFKTPLFIGVGRFVNKKAPYYTILAFSQVLVDFPSAKLIIAGNGPLHNTCKNLVEYLKISNNVTLPGIITPKELAIYFKDALAFVQHSITADNGDMEGTPVAVLEASAASLPVISTYHAGIPDVIIDGKTGYLVNEHDVDEMASKMIILLDDFSMAQQMGSEGKRFIKEKYSKDIHIGILNDAIEKSREINSTKGKHYI